MAQLTITVPDDQVPRVVAALESQLPRLDGEDDATFAQRAIVAYLRHTVRRHEWQQQANAIDVDADGIASAT